MSLSMLSNLTYNQRWGYSGVEKPEDFDEVHAVALLINEYVTNWQASKRRHEADVTAIGEGLRQVAVNRAMCEEFEQEMNKITDKLFHRVVWAKAVDRCRDFTVTLTFTTHSLNRHSALDAVLQRMVDPFNYNGTSGIPRLVNRSAELVEGQTALVPVEDEDEEEDERDDEDD